jgi:hypothetical protein
MPEMGVMTPMKTSEEGGMLRVVLPNKTAVEVIVVRPMNGVLQICWCDVKGPISTDRLREETMLRDNGMYSAIS